MQSPKHAVFVHTKGKQTYNYGLHNISLLDFAHVNIQKTEQYFLLFFKCFSFVCGNSRNFSKSVEFSNNDGLKTKLLIIMI